MNTSYHLSSTWRVESPPEHVWSVITDAKTWPLWWPGLETTQSTPTGPAQVGGTVTATFRSISGYRLRLILTDTLLVQPSRIEFSSAGDLEGTGTWVLREQAGLTEITISWDVKTTKVWMNRYAKLLRPLFIYSHTRLMEQGEAGLQQYTDNLK